MFDQTKTWNLISHEQNCFKKRFVRFVFGLKVYLEIEIYIVQLNRFNQIHIFLVKVEIGGDENQP